MLAVAPSWDSCIASPGLDSGRGVATRDYRTRLRRRRIDIARLCQLAEAAGARIRWCGLRPSPEQRPTATAATPRLAKASRTPPSTRNSTTRAAKRVPGDSAADMSGRLTMQLSGARSPRHFALAPNQHCSTSMSHRSCSRVRSYESQMLKRTRLSR